MVESGTDRKVAGSRLAVVSSAELLSVVSVVVLASATRTVSLMDILVSMISFVFSMEPGMESGSRFFFCAVVERVMLKRNRRPAAARALVLLTGRKGAYIRMNGFKSVLLWAENAFFSLNEWGKQ